MHTHRSFLAFAAAAQIISPLAGAIVGPGAAKRMVAERLPGVLLQTQRGRDIHFFNDCSTGQLAILDLRFDVESGADGTAAAVLRERRPGHDAYMYSLTRQASIRNEGDLRRYMEWYGAAAGADRPPAAACGVELLRLRFGVLVGAP